MIELQPILSQVWLSIPPGVASILKIFVTLIFVLIVLLIINSIFKIVIAWNQYKKLKLERKQLTFTLKNWMKQTK